MDPNEQLARQLVKLGHSLYHPSPVWPDPTLDTLRSFVRRLKARTDRLCDLFSCRLVLQLRVGRVGVQPVGRQFCIDRASTWDLGQFAASQREQLLDNFHVAVGIGIVSRSYMPADIAYIADGDVEWAAVEAQRRLARECVACHRCGPLIDHSWHGDPADVGPFDQPPARAYLIYLAFRLSDPADW